MFSVLRIFGLPTPLLGDYTLIKLLDIGVEKPFKNHRGTRKFSGEIG